VTLLVGNSKIVLLIIALGNTDLLSPFLLLRPPLLSGNPTIFKEGKTVGYMGFDCD